MVSERWWRIDDDMRDRHVYITAMRDAEERVFYLILIGSVNVYTAGDRERERPELDLLVGRLQGLKT